jgi:hypothetical protein
MPERVKNSTTGAGSDSGKKPVCVCVCVCVCVQAALLFRIRVVSDTDLAHTANASD